MVSASWIQSVAHRNIDFVYSCLLMPLEFNSKPVSVLEHQRAGPPHQEICVIRGSAISSARIRRCERPDESATSCNDEFCYMRAIQLLEPQQFRLIDIPEPTEPGPDEALVRVHRVGICGTDISGYLGKMPFYSYPRIPGHELGVEVVAVGSGVTNVKPGDKCSVEPYINNPASFKTRSPTVHGMLFLYTGKGG